MGLLSTLANAHSHAAPFVHSKCAIQKKKKRQQQTKTRKAPYESVRTDTDTAGPGAQAVREASVPS
jgi:hypothetical protein